MIGIYKITNKINGKIYIGQSTDIKRRIYDHRTKAFQKGSLNYNTIIESAIRKYGKENFLYEVIEECKEEELDEKEQYWIKYYDCCVLDGKNKGYNNSRGGESWRKITLSEELKQEIKENKFKSIDEIANKIGCSKIYAYGLLKSNNLKPPTRLSEDTIDLIVDYYQTHNIKQTAEFFEVSPNTIRRKLVDRDAFEDAVIHNRKIKGQTYGNIEIKETIAMKVHNLKKSGKTNKEIADILNISLQQAITYH